MVTLTPDHLLPGSALDCIVAQYSRNEPDCRDGGGDATGSRCSFRHAFRADLPKSAISWHPVIPVVTAADDNAWELTDFLDQGMVCHIPS